MRRHRLVERVAPDALLDVAGELCGLHAQVASAAELTAWTRIDGLEQGAVEAALWEREELVKTWAQRGTLHLLPTRDVPVWHAAMSTYAHFLKGAWVRSFGFASADEVEELIAAIGAVLQEQGPLTREELAIAVAERTGDDSYRERLREGFGAALKPAAFRGLLAFAPNSGQNVRFRTPPETKQRPSQDDGVAEATRRYLAAYGPARREDLSRWWGSPALSPAQAQKRIEALGDEVTQVDVEGAKAYVLTSDVEELHHAEPPEAARLLPMFDQYVVGSNRGVEQLLPQRRKDAVFRQAGWISPTVVVDGAIAGVWSHERKGPDLVVEVEPFARLPKWASAQLEHEAERLAAFLGGQLTLRGTS